jgi:hypothetical protein
MLANPVFGWTDASPPTALSGRRIKRRGIDRTSGAKADMFGEVIMSPAKGVSNVVYTVQVIAFPNNTIINADLFRNRVDAEVWEIRNL